MGFMAYRPFWTTTYTFWTAFSHKTHRPHCFRPTPTLWRVVEHNVFQFLNHFGLLFHSMVFVMGFMAYRSFWTITYTFWTPATAHSAHPLCMPFSTISPLFSLFLLSTFYILPAHRVSTYSKFVNKKLCSRYARHLYIVS